MRIDQGRKRESLAHLSGNAARSCSVAAELSDQEIVNLEFGARRLRRTIDKYIEDPLAEKLLGDDFQDCDTILIIASQETTADRVAIAGGR